MVLKTSTWLILLRTLYIIKSLQDYNFFLEKPRPGRALSLALLKSRHGLRCGYPIGRKTALVAIAVAGPSQRWLSLGFGQHSAGWFKSQQESQEPLPREECQQKLWTCFSFKLWSHQDEQQHVKPKALLSTCRISDRISKVKEVTVSLDRVTWNL